MRPYLFVLVFALVLTLATGASANIIGLFADEEATICEADFLLYTYTTVYVMAVLSDIDAITAAEFLIDGVIINQDVIITQTWNSPLTIGDALGAEGFSIAFTIPLSGPVIMLGDLRFFVLGEWPGPNEQWCVVETNDSGVLILVDDEFVTHEAFGWCFYPNCEIGGPYGECACWIGTPTTPTTWGGMKALY